MKNNALIMLAVVLLPLTVEAETLENNLVKCAKIQDSLARLVCFDEITKQVGTSTSVITAPSRITEKVTKVEVLTVAEETKPETKAANFGAEHLKKSNVTEEDLQIVYTVEQLSKDQYGKWRFTFTNGQKWKQTDSAFLKLTVGESVQLKKGFMNAVYLKKNELDSNKKIRVKRLK